MNAIEIITAWNALTPEQQINFCTNCIKKGIKHGRRIGDGYELGDIVQSTWEAVEKRTRDVDSLEADIKERQAQGKTDTLATVIIRAANASLENSRYHGQKHAVATSQTITGEDGEELDLLDTIADTADTEAAATLRADLQRFFTTRDATDRQIIGGIVDGMTEREIAATVGISNVAVHKRIVKIRNELRREIA